MKPRTPGIWLIAVLLGLLALPPAYAGMTPEEVRQFKTYKARAEQGNANAQGWVGYYYNNGFGVARDQVQAVYWFSKAAAQGDSYSQYILGLRYARGDGVAKDCVQAVALWRKAADQG